MLFDFFRRGPGINGGNGYNREIYRQEKATPSLLMLINPITRISIIMHVINKGLLMESCAMFILEIPFSGNNDL
jgi:hypothetical protein